MVWCAFLDSDIPRMSEFGVAWRYIMFLPQQVTVCFVLKKSANVCDIGVIWRVAWILTWASLAYRDKNDWYVWTVSGVFWKLRICFYRNQKHEFADETNIMGLGIFGYQLKFDVRHTSHTDLSYLFMFVGNLWAEVVHIYTYIGIISIEELNYLSTMNNIF